MAYDALLTSMVTLVEVGLCVESPSYSTLSLCLPGPRAVPGMTIWALPELSSVALPRTLDPWRTVTVPVDPDGDTLALTLPGVP